MNYIILAIPVFFLLIGIEALVDKLKKTNYYRFNDAITNLSCGTGQQVIGVFLKMTIIFSGYFYLFENETLRAWFGERPYPGGEFSTGAIIATWIILFIGVDFFYYWFHRLAHEISFLWGSHIVHHQSEEYNLTVALRQAWVQGAFSWVFYLPLAVLGFHPLMFITVNSFQTLYQFWIHTKAINKMPKAFEYVMNTPSHHRVHHGVNPKYIDRNHGGTLIIFDRMFGTFQAEEEEVVYGITRPAASWNPLWVNFEYWIDLFKEVSKASKWQDKLKMLVYEPGWKPEELGGIQKPKEVTSETFKKYDVKVPDSINYYVLLQYIIVIAGTTGFLFNLETFSALEQAGISSLIILSIVNLGGLLEKKRWVFYLEFIRLALIYAIFFGLFFEPNITLALFSALLLLVSSVWVLKHRMVFLQKAY